MRSTMRQAHAAAAAGVAIRAATLCGATLLGLAWCVPATYGADADYHTQGSESAQSQSAQAEPGTADLEGELASAREQLEQAARRVAELSAQLGAGLGNRVRIERSFQRGAIGLQLDPASGRRGARVMEVSPGGPAAEGGVLPGDLIIAVNGVPISGEDTAGQVAGRMSRIPPNTPVRLRLERGGKGLSLKLTTRPTFTFTFESPFAGAAASAASAMAPSPLMPAEPGPVMSMPALPSMAYFQALTAETEGMELAALTPALGRYFGTDEGVLVIRAPSDDAFRLEDGDVILSIDGRKPLNGAHATRILSSYQPGERITLRIMRERQPMSLAITLPDAPR